MEITIYFRCNFNFKYFKKHLERENKNYPFEVKCMPQPYPGSDERDIWNSLVILLEEYSSDITLKACEDFLGTLLLYWVDIYGYLPDLSSPIFQMNHSFSFKRHKEEIVERKIEITRKVGEEVIKEMIEERKVSHTDWNIILEKPKCVEKE